MPAFRPPPRYPDPHIRDANGNPVNININTVVETGGNRYYPGKEHDVGCRRGLFAELPTGFTTSFDYTTSTSRTRWRQLHPAADAGLRDQQRNCAGLRPDDPAITLQQQDDCHTLTKSILKNFNQSRQYAEGVDIEMAYRSPTSRKPMRTVQRYGV